ncbi:MAG: hypothetical protein ABI247_13965 [Rhodanobacter sp.]
MAMTVGSFGYGVSLVLFVRALRGLVTLSSGGTNVMQGAAHLVLFDAYLFLDVRGLKRWSQSVSVRGCHRRNRCSAA